jgi:Ca2+-binding RTX toxin-like protein
VGGSVFDDRMLGSRAHEALFGDFGDDYLDGRRGNDVLAGGADSDTLIGGAGHDRLQGDLFDIFEFRPGNDLLKGGAGNDALSGGALRDTLVGGAGCDDFVFDSAPGAENADLVKDFASGRDELVFVKNASPGVYAELGPEGEWQQGDERFHAAPGATSGREADDRLIYDTCSGNLYYDADGSGAGEAELVATLACAPKLEASDIAVVLFS